MTYFTTASRAIRRQQNIFGYQLFRTACVLIAALGVVIANWIFPTFFPYTYFRWGGIGSVLAFWPLFAWGAGLTIALHLLIPGNWLISEKESRELLGWEVVTSTMAGIWEELGYRWAFIMYAMIGIWFLNLVFSWGLGWLLVLVFGVIAFVLMLQREMPQVLVGIACATAAVFFGYFAMHANPVYWIHSFIVWIVYFTTFTLMDPVLYNGHPPLLIFGAVLANVWFRDGHKYQGPLGIVNSWYAGMVLLYATFVYGLFTAIVVHALYNIIISVLRYLFRNNGD